MDVADTDSVRVWLVERTHSDDEQNSLMLTYATPDGTYSFRKERALPSFRGGSRETTAATDVDLGNLSTIDDAALQEQYATEAEHMASKHDPGDLI